MASNTPNLNLLKKDPVTDGDDTFNIKTMLNDNWDKIDAAMGQVDIPDASLTVKGKVQLSSATDSEAQDRAATPKAVKDASLQARSYTDQQISLVTETGIPKLVSYPLLVTATADNQKVFEIPLDLFDANTDTLLVAINRAVLDTTQYTVTNTIRDGAGQVTQRAKINLLSGVATTSEVTMVVLKNVPIGPDGAINGAVLATDSVPINRVNGLQDQLDQAFQAGNERKKEVVDALVALGVPASTNDSWDMLISKMATIIKATGNAAVGDVLAGKTFSNASAAGLTGTMPNQGAEIITPGTANQTIAAGYQNGSGYVKGDPSLVAGNFPKDITIFGIIGLLERMTTAEKLAIVNAITGKGVAASVSDSNTVLANKISQIPTGGYAIASKNMNFQNTGVYTETIFDIPPCRVFSATNNDVNNSAFAKNSSDDRMDLVLTNSSNQFVVLQALLGEDQINIYFTSVNLEERTYTTQAGHRTRPPNSPSTGQIPPTFDLTGLRLAVRATRVSSSPMSASTWFRLVYT